MTRQEAERILRTLPEVAGYPGDVALPFPETTHYRLPKGAAYPGGRGRAETGFTARWQKHMRRTTVAIDDLVATQTSVDPEQVRLYLTEHRLPIVVVVQPDGRQVIADGHHRALAALLLGQTRVDAYVYDGPLDV